ncbi:MAG: hypothetical protein AAGA42_19750 [Actinomycetota bacterium]
MSDRHDHHDQLLTRVDERWRTQFGEGCRAMAWSPRGRLFVIGADGRSLVDLPGQVTAPMAPDPIAAAWLGERRVAVVDAVAGAVFSGAGNIDSRVVPGARCVGAAGGRTVVAGADVVAVFAEPDAVAPPEMVSTPIGQSHVLAHTVGAQWVVGGTRGLALVDAALGCVDLSIELDGVRAVAYAAGAEQLVAADLAGSLHVIDVGTPEEGIELDGYPDPVQHMAVTVAGDLIVAAADDELTWWRLDEHGHPGDTPARALGHDAPITAVAMSVDDLVVSGDAEGMVRFWSAQMPDYPVTSLSFGAEIVDAQWAPDGRQLAVAAMNGEVGVFGVTPGALA